MNTVFIIAVLVLLLFCNIWLGLICWFLFDVLRTSQQIEPETSIKEGGINLSFFNRPRPRIRKAVKFTDRSRTWIKNRETASKGVR